MVVKMQYLFCLVVSLRLTAGHMVRSNSARHKRDAQDFGDGTTNNLKDIMLGRCYDNDCLTCTDPPSTCSEVWDAFSTGVTSSSQCDMTPEDYDQFFKIAPINLPEGKTAFWSGTYGLVHELTRLTDKFYTMEDTFTGSLVNSLNWCKGGGDFGFNYTACPEWTSDTCYGQSTSVFWNRASAEFSRQARGLVTAVLSGTDTRNTFRNSSFFGRVEVPNLRTPEVTHMDVILLHAFGEEVLETCDNSISLPWLWQMLDDKQITHSCEDDPDYSVHTQCSSSPDDPACDAVGSGTQITSGVSFLLAIGFIFHLLNHEE